MKFNKYFLQAYSYPALSCELLAGTEDGIGSHPSRIALKTQALKMFC